ncbi:DnaT-like ssDNA-binding protein [Duganella sp. BJB475]|uniref:DnaT-like ssDNA-binding protein n=1 Tax=Duganella sp. BJB475 TaxID=2233914 RepID=UPI000E34E07A|nr:DnaT-like ssDNA-binding protein [Duganella sp. BJB475]RFP19187.1 hypothetical protein D0T23_05260 [Duganella sp. BJB475]
MTLIVETGVGLANAESYISVADATTYHANRGNSAWAALASDIVREQLLRQATEYMVGRYRDNWKGQRTGIVQALDWPRYNVQLPDVGFGAIAAYVPWNVVPVEVANACAVLALQAISGPLAPNLERTIKQDTVGPLTTIYADGAPEKPRYTAVDNMLKAYLAGSGTSGKLVRG